MMSSFPLMRRLSAVGLLVLAVGLLLVAGVLPIAGLIEDYDRTIVESEESLAQALQIASRRAGLVAERAALSEQLSSNSGFLEGDSAELIAANLQDQLKQLTGRFGATLNSTQALASEDESGYLKVTVRLNMTGDTVALQRVLHALESATPFLFVDNLELRSGAIRKRLLETEEADVLQIRFDVFGFVRSTGANS